MSDVFFCLIQYSSLLPFFDINIIHLPGLCATNQESLIEHTAGFYFSPDCTYDRYDSDYNLDLGTMSVVEIK